MPCKDRLAELNNSAEQRVYNDTVELYVKEPPGGGLPEDIAKIFTEVEKIRAWIQDMNANTQLIRALHSDATYYTNRNLQDQLDAAVTRTNGIGLKVCGALRQFEEMMKGYLVNDVRGRIARLQYATTRALYADALAPHHTQLQQIRDTQHALLQGQVKLTNLTVSEEECEALLDTNNIQLFVDNIQAQTQEARLALRDVEARHKELQKIESSIMEVHDLFTQMARLVVEQQELVDTVEYYANQTTVQVKSGGHELLKGSVSQTKARQKKVSLIICLVCGFLIVLIVLIIT